MLKNQKLQVDQKLNPFASMIEKKQQELQKQGVQQPVSLFQQNTTGPVQGFLQQQQTNQIQTSGSFLFTNQTQSKPAINPFTQITATQQQLNTNNNTGW